MDSYDIYEVSWNMEKFVQATLPAVEVFLADFVFLKRGTEYKGEDAKLKEMLESGSSDV